MRFTEIINPEDQLALWRLISDKVWATLGEPIPKFGATQQKPMPYQDPIKASKPKTTTLKSNKAKKGVMGPPVPQQKPFPKATVVPTPIEVKQQQSKQNSQLAQAIGSAVQKSLKEPVRHVSKRENPPSLHTVDKVEGAERKVHEPWELVSPEHRVHRY